MRVTYRHIRPMPVLFARINGPYAWSTREAWKVMGRWLDAHNARRQMKVSYGIFRDNPRLTAAGLLRYDACIPLIAGLDADPAAGIARQTFAGGAYGVHTHVGAYDATGEIFSEMHRKIISARGLMVDYQRPFVAVYLNDPTVTAELHRRTELCVPVIPIRMPAWGNDEGDGFASSAALVTACSH